MVALKVWIPEEYHVKWLKKVFDFLKEGGQWIAPATNHIFQKQGNALVWKNHDVMKDEHEIYARSEIIGKCCGIEVIKENKNDK
jgi:hypothetical protein